MIDVKDLRIGNYVINGDYADIGTMMVHHVSDQDIHYESLCSVNSVEASRINSIPITEEWLFSLGFVSMDLDYSVAYYIEYVKNVRFQVWLDGSCRIWYNAGKGWQEHYDNELPIHVKSVHQLQNIYFALTGKELEHKNVIVND